MTGPARPANGSAPPADASTQAAPGPPADGRPRDRTARLARLDADIADAGQRITQQVLRCELMRFDGRDTREAMRLLRTFEAIYVELVRFRQILLDMPPRTAVPDPPEPRDGPSLRPRPGPRG